MSERLSTRSVREPDDIRAFFDAIADRYREAHGDQRRLLERRLALIRRLIGTGCADTLLDLGCGPGVHLFPLAPGFRRAIGVDLSPRMIAVAAQIALVQDCGARVELHTADAARLDCVAPDSIDVVLCAGALEHMHDPAGTLAEVARVLKPGGRFVCLTVNGAHFWYRRLAPMLGFDARHLSSDRFLDAASLQAIVRQARLDLRELGYWAFIASGDMPQWAAWLLQLAEYAGRLWQPGRLRGGLYVSAVKPLRDDGGCAFRITP
jgi:ubiquinone/menaquinone biosynthesis C-methylase UbiE